MASPGAPSLLHSDKILACVQAQHSRCLQQCDVLAVTESTNTLAASQPPGLHQARVWFAEYQTAGRGRRGRSWVGDSGRNLQFSLAYQFDLPMSRLAGLSIAVGAVLAVRLNQHGLQNVGLKWPNDVMCGGKKLAGILLEVNGATTGPSVAIIGIGLNVQMDHATMQSIDRPVTSLRAQGCGVERNQLAGELLDDLLALCINYPIQGLQPYLSVWRQYDLYHGKPVSLLGPNQAIQGIQTGLADDGGLLLAVDGQINIYYAGELSLRPVSAS